MNWNKDKSITLSQCCVIFFGAALLALDIFSPKIAGWYGTELSAIGLKSGTVLLAVIYSGSVFAWICLWKLWELLASIKRGDVFTAENVKRMRRVSWCCVWAAAICLAGGFLSPSFILFGAAAAFMALIVRIVKNIFEQAVSMKSELDLTV